MNKNCKFWLVPIVVCIITSMFVSTCKKLGLEDEDSDSSPASQSGTTGDSNAPPSIEKDDNSCLLRADNDTTIEYASKGKSAKNLIWNCASPYANWPTKSRLEYFFRDDSGSECYEHKHSTVSYCVDSSQVPDNPTTDIQFEATGTAITYEGYPCYRVDYSVTNSGTITAFNFKISKDVSSDDISNSGFQGSSTGMSVIAGETESDYFRGCSSDYSGSTWNINVTLADYEEEELSSKQITVSIP